MFGGDEPTPASSAAPNIPASTATAEPSSNRVTVAVDVIPPDATVIVDGTERPLKSGVLELEGQPGQEIVVTIQKGDLSRKETVTITLNGPRPGQVILAAPETAGSATPSAQASTPVGPAPPTARSSGSPAAGGGGKTTPPTAVPVHAPVFE